MWCTSCQKNVHNDASNALIRHNDTGWVHILLSDSCAAHTTAGDPVIVEPAGCGALRAESQRNPPNYGAAVYLKIEPFDVPKVAAIVQLTGHDGALNSGEVGPEELQVGNGELGDG
jgi:hypothetical protein